MNVRGTQVIGSVFSDYGQPYLGGFYYTVPCGEDAGGFSPTTQRLYGLPWFNTQAQRFTSLGCEVTAADAGAGDIVLGVYGFLRNGFPGPLPINGNESHDTSTTGDKETAIDVVLRRGWYLLTMHVIVVTSLTVRGLNTREHRGYWGIGAAPSGNENFYVTGGHTISGSTMPDPFDITTISPAGAVSSASTDASPMIAIKTAAIPT